MSPEMRRRDRGGGQTTGGWKEQDRRATTLHDAPLPLLPLPSLRPLKDHSIRRIEWGIQSGTGMNSNSIF